MSDVHVDKLNNSQLMLLVLLISLVVSAATAVATLSVVYDRLALASGEAVESQPTIIRQTINRIIEREPALLSSDAVADISHEVGTGAGLILSAVQQSLVRLYFGSQPFAYGVYVSPDGHILASEVLDEQRRYSVLDERGQPTFFSLLYNDEAYSLLSPVDADSHNVRSYVSLEHLADVLFGQSVSLGASVVIFGGLEQGTQLRTGIVSQKKIVADAVDSVLISPSLSDTAIPLMVFIDDLFVGFTQPYSDWVSLLDSTFVAGAMQAMQLRTVIEGDALIDVGSSQ